MLAVENLKNDAVMELFPLIRIISLFVRKRKGRGEHHRYFTRTFSSVQRFSDDIAWQPVPVHTVDNDKDLVRPDTLQHDFACDYRNQCR